MGTNYYAVESTCSNPDHDELVHIGKSSHGWRFLFRRDDERRLTSPGRWHGWLIGKRIVDEYGDPIEFWDLYDKINRKRKLEPHDTAGIKSKRFVVADMVDGDFT